MKTAVEAEFHSQRMQSNVSSLVTAKRRNRNKRKNKKKRKKNVSNNIVYREWNIFIRRPTDRNGEKTHKLCVAPANDYILFDATFFFFLSVAIAAASASDAIEFCYKNYLKSSSYKENNKHLTIKQFLQMMCDVNCPKIQYVACATLYNNSSKHGRVANNYIKTIFIAAHNGRGGEKMPIKVNFLWKSN